MKFSRKHRSSEAGNLLLVAMMVGGVAGLTLASYLVMTQQQSVSIYRSQTWNSSMPTTEAGVEDGMQLINLYAGSFAPEDLFKWTNNASAAGWDSPSANVYHVQRFLTNTVTSSTVVTSYDAWIFNTNNAPTVFAVGTIPWNYFYAANPTLPPIFAAVNGGTAPANDNSANLSRRVSVQTHFDPLFVVAMAAIGNINLNGNGVATDSFDSSDPNFSSNGMYPSGIASRTRANGDVCTDAAIVDSLNIGNADIKGYVRTGPGANTMTILANGSVGDRAWVEGGSNGIEPGHSSTDFNVLFPAVKEPESIMWLPLPTTGLSTNGISYNTAVTTPGFYYVSTLPSKTLIMIPSNMVVNIRITGSVNMSGNDTFDIANTGGKVRIYMEGSSFSCSGNSGINNMSGYASNFYFYGLNTCTSINFGGNAAFTGGLYAPNAAFSAGGGGNNNYDFIGASVTRTVTMNGHFNFHFDENLAKVGPGRGYIPVAWREM